MLLNCLDEAFNLTNVFASCSGVYFSHVILVFDLVKFLVHHDNFDDEAGADIKPDYFC